MKKEKIYNLIIAVLCFILWFMPIERANDTVMWMFPIRALFSPFILSAIEHLREILIVVFGFISIMLLILHICKYTVKTKSLATIGLAIYVFIWIIALFVHFPFKGSILFNLSRDAAVIWIVLYFALLLAIIVLTTLQWLPARRSTKAKRMQEQIEELQAQVDELKKGD